MSKKRIYYQNKRYMRIRACGRVYAHTHCAHTSMRVCYLIFYLITIRLVQNVITMVPN